MGSCWVNGSDVFRVSENNEMDFLWFLIHFTVTSVFLFCISVLPVSVVPSKSLLTHSTSPENFCFFQDAAQILSLLWRFHWFLKLVKHSLFRVVFLKRTQFFFFFYIPLIEIQGLCPFPLLLGGPVAVLSNRDCGWSGTSILWGWIIKGEAASKLLAGTHALGAWGRHARRRPGAVERPWVCILVSSPTHSVFPLADPDFVKHTQAISSLSLLCLLQSPNPPNLCK